jgi:sRNA-binding protein
MKKKRDMKKYTGTAVYKEVDAMEAKAKIYDLKAKAKAKEAKDKAAKKKRVKPKKPNPKPTPPPTKVTKPKVTQMRVIRFTVFAIIVYSLVIQLSAMNFLDSKLFDVSIHLYII